MDDLYVLKFGGNAIRGRDDMMRLSGEIAELIHDGDRIILVHGGGPEISEEMERRGMIPRKVCGVRVTDADSLEVAEIVLRRLNAEIVGCLQECTVCTRKPPMKVVEDGKEVEVDLGLVGEVSGTDPQCLFDLLEQGITPVIYPIGKDAEGRMLNVNADTMVAGVAAGVECSEMITITDVPGIMLDINNSGSKVDSLTLADVDRLIADGTISGGMIPKVEACRKALLAGVTTVRMVNGKDPRSIITDIKKGVPHGTIITK